MPYYSSDTFQKNTYSRKRGRHHSEVSPRDPEGPDRFHRIVRRRLEEEIQIANNNGGEVLSPIPQSASISSMPSSVDNQLPTHQVGLDMIDKPYFQATTSYQTSTNGPKRSPTGFPSPSKSMITQSQRQKENRLLVSINLASPFKGTSSGPSVLSKSSNSNSRSSKIFRRPSADTFNAHISSTAASFRRRPSGSHALQTKSKNYDGWLVPFLPLPVLNLAKAKPTLVFEDLDVMNSRLRFSPQLCSTPKRHPSLTDQTKDRISMPVFGSKDSDDVLMKDEVAVQMDYSDSAPSDSPGLCISVAGGPDDTVQPVELTQVVCRGNELVVKSLSPLTESVPSPPKSHDPQQPSSEPDSMHLRMMFSGLDLAEELAPQESVIKPTSSSIKIKKSKPVVEVPKKIVRFSVKIPSPKETKPVAKRPKIRVKYKSPPQNYRSKPPPITTDNQPLTVEDDEDDVLLLTSKGWDWDPFAQKRVI